ncbi:MAG: glycerophosphodiester phosphodiesterase [Xanthomonadaceae bacterium]|nr:glycerophosphodiester phosphodiesterase [Xanthomonadaceae bacterium]HLT43162.1 glycerophosphodiester phosphodiesterase family protein [Luteimonas sp.]
MPHAPRPLLIAHRGASALLPEHTLAAYRRAIEDGADAIEPDLVMTRDGVLVARHENRIDATTDVAAHPSFAARRTRKRIDGAWVEGWFTEDFTLDELRRLRARERLPDIRPTLHDGLHPVATFEEIVELAAEASARLGRDVAVVPETKHPSYFASLGLAMEEPLLRAIDGHPWACRAPLIIQSFEDGNLRRLREWIDGRRNIRLLQLTCPDPGAIDAREEPMHAPGGLREVATYADILGPPHQALRVAGGRSRLVDDAHAAGLQVMPWTYRPENRFLPPRLRDGPPAARNEAGAIRQLVEHLDAGIDGLFADDPAVAARAVAAHAARSL